MDEQTSPAAGRRSVLSRWWLWAAIGVVLLLAGALLAYQLTNSDSAKTKELRQWLTDAHLGDRTYQDLGTATYSDGNVTVDASHTWTDREYGAYFLCAWVEPWLRDEGNGGPHSQIVVNMGGQEVLRSLGASDSCEQASYRASTGG
jgi:hypothetical protein